MEAPWRNPEFVRHYRRELRPNRMLIAAAVPVLVCVLMLIVIAEGDRDTAHHIRWSMVWDDYYSFVVVVQGLLLNAWCAATNAQAVSSERQLKTIDFLRTTRLTSVDLTFGMALGRPIMAYFIYGCVLPFTVVSGALAGYKWGTLLGTQAILLITSVAISFAGMLFSLLTEKPRSGEFLALIFVLYWLFYLMGSGWQRTGNFSMYAAVEVIPALANLHGVFALGFHPTFFLGRQVSPAWGTALLYLLAGAVMALAVVRNMKKDREELRLYSRWQAVGLVALLCALYLAQLNLAGADTLARFEGAFAMRRFVQAAETVYLCINLLMFYCVGIAMLAPAGARKHWWREKSRGLSGIWSPDAPPIPWMGASAAISWMAIAVAAEGYSRHFSKIDDWHLRNVGAQLLVIVVYAMRDVLFLQWCTSTQIKSPMLKGTLLVGLYYFAASAGAAGVQALTGSAGELRGYALVTPIGGLVGERLTESLLGAGLQVGVMVFLLIVTRARYVRRTPAVVPI